MAVRPLYGGLRVASDQESLGRVLLRLSKRDPKYISDRWIIRQAEGSGEPLWSHQASCLRLDLANCSTSWVSISRLIFMMGLLSKGIAALPIKVLIYRIMIRFSLVGLKEPPEGAAGTPA